jgi:hypothetical protein
MTGGTRNPRRRPSDRTGPRLRWSRRGQVALPVLATMFVAMSGPLVPSDAAAHRSSQHVVTCHGTGARWHLHDYFYTDKRDASGNIVYRPASGDHYRWLGINASFCRKSSKWIRRLTAAKPEAGYSGKIWLGRFRFPPGYGPILLGDGVPGYVCMAEMNDTRPGHHGDNSHSGACGPRAGRESSLPSFPWFPVLPSSTQPTS